MAEQPAVDKLIHILQTCRKMKNLAYAKYVCVQIFDNGLEAHSVLGNFLVPMFVECGSLSDAKQVFNMLTHRNEHCWTSLIQGYVQCGELQQAMNLFQEMQEDSVQSSRYTFVAILKACAKLKCLERGRELHAQIVKHGLKRDPFVGSTLVDMFAKCGSPAEAWDVFDKLPSQDVVSWTALIAGYVEHGRGEEALNCFQQMQVVGVSPDAVTLVCSLKACGSMGAIERGQGIHSESAKLGFEKGTAGNALVDMYAKCSSLSDAKHVFDNMSARDIALWNVLIAGYAEHGLLEDALNCFVQMKLEGISPNSATFVCSLKACSSIGAIVRGREIHSEVLKQGFERDSFVGSTLVDMYAKGGSLTEAQEMFDRQPAQNLISWTSLIAGYAEQGLGEEALNCLHWMQLQDIFPDAFASVCSLKGCSSIGAVDRGREIHAKTAKDGFERNPFVGSSLVDMYAKCGSVVEAQKVFDDMPVQSVVLWNTLITGYAEHELGEDVLNCLEIMQTEGKSMNPVTFICSLKACGNLGAIERGQEIHTEIVKQGLESSAFLGNTLVDMYAKCGSLSEAGKVFDKLVVQDLISWTALISGYACKGESDQVFQFFYTMRKNDVQPDGVTFLGVLTACSHAGLVDKGQEYFKAMSIEYGIIPTIEHHNCMVDLVSRAGQLNEALAMLEEMPFQADCVTWNVMLGACQMWGNVEIGRHAFEYAVRLDENCGAAFIVMSNIYADAHMWEDVKKLDALRKRINY